MGKMFHLYSLIFSFISLCVVLLNVEFSVFVLKVFENMKKREETKQAEFAAKVAEFNQMRAQHETVSKIML